MIASADLRICFVGDSMVAGTGDPQALGWCGRVVAQSATQGFALSAYNLGVRRDTSTDIAQRWREECARRLPPDCTPHVVFNFGVNDTTQLDGGPRVSTHDSIANLRTILNEAQSRYRVAMIGPPPIADAAQNPRIRALCVAFRSACASLSVPYLAVFDALHANTIWMQQVAAGDGAHPQAEGYRALAALVLDWPQWWFRRSLS